MRKLLQSIKCLFGYHEFENYEMGVSRPERIRPDNEFGIRTEVHEACKHCDLIRMRGKTYCGYEL